MTKKRILLASVAVLALGAAAAAVAATGHRGYHHGRGGHGPGEMLGMGGGMMGGMGMAGMGMGGGMGRLDRLNGLDTNGDGAITEAEMLAQPAQMFARTDKNSDGSIDATDIEATVKENVDYMVKRMLHRFDKDKDGKITREEFQTAMRDRGGMTGRGGEGRGPGRWGRHHGGDEQSDGPRHGGMGRMGMGPGGEPGQGGGPGMHDGMGRGRGGGIMGGRGARMFDRYDVNGDGVLDANEIAQHQQKAVTEGVKRMTARLDLGADGKLTRDAFLAKAKARFADLDLDSDGRITDADLPPMMRGRGILK